MKRIILTVFTSFLVAFNSFAQITQTISGKVFDAVTGEGLVGATVIVADSEPVIGTVCDVDGNFTLENVPVGRQNIQASMMGYDIYVARELMVSSGKATILNMALQTSNVGLEEVVITTSKDAPINTMTTLSARQFTVEETQRYAGGFDDPARLATSFAGVASPSVSSNGISVRGNNPQGLLWRIEGVEVPTPNHFANLTVIGGGLYTILSNQMLANSDFYTGAFPAEYGNASSGVFDIRMKTGNTTNREYTLQAGVIGIDFATEGPFKKGKSASYAMNYRYSTFGLIAPVLPDDAGLMKYQDLSFKTVFPTQKAGTFSLWSIAALDGIKMDPADSSDWEADTDRDKSDDQLYMFASGLSHKMLLGKKTFLNTSIAASGNGLTHEEERLYDNDNLQAYPQSDVSDREWRFTLQSTLNHRFGDQHTNSTGFYYTHLGYHVDIQEAPSDGLPLSSLAKGNGATDLIQIYTQSKINPTPQLTLNVGVHYQHFLLNNNAVIEPRIGIKYDIGPKHSIALAYGLHSRIEGLAIYFANINGTYPNKALDLMKSNHFILGYEAKLSENLRLKIEPYYQYLTDVPVSPTSYVSTLNIENSIFFSHALTNKGTGRNVGIDITLERFLSNGFYYLATASLFDSKYTAADGIQRNTRYNKNYVCNVLLGKEWMVGKNGQHVLGANIRLNYLGGNRLEAIDATSSMAAHKVIYGETNSSIAYDKQLKDMPVFSIGASYRRNKPRYASIWSFQIINALNAEEFVEDYYNVKSHTIEQKYDKIIVPNISYKIEF